VLQRLAKEKNELRGPTGGVDYDISTGPVF